MAIFSFPSSLSALLPVFLLLLLAQNTSAKSAASLNLCPLNSTDTIANTNITWGQVLDLPIRDLGGSSYIRPDVGGALLPWIYTIIVIIVHVPTVVVRVVRWQMVQTWCLASTILTLVITIQGYKSTAFAPDMILTWTPLLLVIDAGSMAQVLFLIIEDRHLLSRLWKRLTPTKEKANNGILENGILLGGNPADPSSVWNRDESKYEPAMNLEDLGIGRDTRMSVAATTATKTTVLKDDALYVAIFAFALLVTIFVLQILGIIRAVAGAQGPAPLVSSCSPIFQPYGIAVLDGNCNIYSIEQNFLKGVGCIYMPGTRQMSWLKATVAGTSLALIFQTVDICLLTMVHSKARWRGTKMRRPWCSMFSGLAILGLLLIYGIQYATTLPPGISERIGVVQSAEIPSVATANLVPAGLRGALLAWNDGIFNSWGVQYYGPSILRSSSTMTLGLCGATGTVRRL